MDPTLQYHMYMHFAELEQLQSNQSIEFNFDIDSIYAYSPFSPNYLSIDTLFIESALNVLGRH